MTGELVTAQWNLPLENQSHWPIFVLLCATAMFTLLCACARGDESPLESTIEINHPNTFQLALPAGRGTSNLAFEVPAMDEGRLKVQLRITAKGADVALVDPSGIFRVASLRDGVVFQPRAALSRSDLGDMILLPEQHSPTAGKWLLRIAYPPQNGDRFALVTVSLFQRYAVNLVSNTRAGSVGDPIILTALPMDNGVPVSGLSPHIVISRKDGEFSNTIEASESATSTAGIRLSNEPGVYIAVYTPSTPGTHQLCPYVTFADGPQVSGNCIQVKVSSSVGN